MLLPFRILYRSKNLVVTFPENIEFYIQVVGFVFASKKSTELVLTLFAVYIVGTSYLFQGSCSVASRGWTRLNAGYWRKGFMFVNESKKMILELKFVTYIRFFGHCHVMIPYMVNVRWFL